MFTASIGKAECIMGGKMSSVSVLKLGLLPLRAAADVWRRRTN